MKYKTIPNFDKMIIPQLETLAELGGTAYIKELNENTIKKLGLKEDLISKPHNNESRETEVEYRLAWARTYLKKYGLINNISRGKWTITEKFTGDVTDFDANDIVNAVKMNSLNSNNLKVESYEAFEKLAWNTLEDIVKTQKKHIKFAPPNIPCDFVLPDGLDKSNGPIYVEVKVAPNQSSLNNFITRLTKVVSTGSVLLIVNNELSDDKIKQMEKSLSSMTQINIKIWDIDILTNRANPTSKYIEYFIDPQKTLIEDTINLSEDEFKKEQQTIIEKFQQSYSEGNITLFLGAGVSKSANRPLWDDLIYNMLIELLKIHMNGEDIKEQEMKALYHLAYDNRDRSPLVQMRYIKSSFKLDEYYKTIHKVLYPQNADNYSKLLETIVNISTPSLAHREIKNIVTYNFDNLIEQAFEKANQPYKTIFREKDIPQIDHHNIYHVHGYLPNNLNEIDFNETELIFSEEDYHRVYRDAYSWSNLAQLNFLRESSCVFIGCSLEDPNLRRLLDVAVRVGEEDKPRHYAFMRKKDFKLKEDFQLSEDTLRAYKNVDIGLRTRYLRGLGLNIIWVDDVEEIPRILMKLIDRKK